jgi:hypothetical protein
MMKSEYDRLHKYKNRGQCFGDVNEFDRLWRLCGICSVENSCRKERDRLNRLKKIEAIG